MEEPVGTESRNWWYLFNKRTRQVDDTAGAWYDMRGDAWGWGGGDDGGGGGVPGGGVDTSLIMTPRQDCCLGGGPTVCSSQL
jgi:hypothetical protein